MHRFPQRAGSLAVNDPNVPNRPKLTLAQVLFQQAGDFRRTERVQVEFPGDRNPDGCGLVVHFRGILFDGLSDPGWRMRVSGGAEPSESTTAPIKDRRGFPKAAAIPAVEAPAQASPVKPVEWRVSLRLGAESLVVPVGAAVLPSPV